MSGFKYVRVWIFQDCYMSGIRISTVTQGLTIFINITGFWVCVWIQLWNGSEYSRISNMSSFCICKRYTRFWICVNNAWINFSDYGSVLNMRGQSFTGFWICFPIINIRARNMARLSICKGYTGCWIRLFKPGCALKIPQYPWICLNNAQYPWICLNIPE